MAGSRLLPGSSCGICSGAGRPPCPACSARHGEAAGKAATVQGQGCRSGAGFAGRGWRSDTFSAAQRDETATNPTGPRMGLSPVPPALGRGVSLPFHRGGCRKWRKAVCKKHVWWGVSYLPRHKTTQEKGKWFLQSGSWQHCSDAGSLIWNTTQDCHRKCKSAEQGTADGTLVTCFMG